MDRNAFLSAMRSVAGSEEVSEPASILTWVCRDTLSPSQKAAIFDALFLATRDLRLFYDEDPSEDFEGWTGDRETGYAIPAKIRVVSLLRFLAPGNWVISDIPRSEASLLEGQDFRKPENVAAFMSKSSANVLITSYFDDTDWIVAVRRG